MSMDEEARLIRYMLNDLPQEECEQIEKRYFEDDAYYEALAALETQLVRDWMSGSLTPKQAEQFESRMGDDAALREHVAMVQALAGTSATTAPAGRTKVTNGVMQFLLFLRETPSAFALAGCGILLVASTLLATLSFVRISRLQDRIATLATLRLAVEPARESSTSDPTFSLLAGARRASGSQPLFVAGGARIVHLQAIVAGRQAGILRIALRNPDNGMQYWSAFVTGGGQIEVAVPAGLLQPGDYVLSAETASGETVESWQFRIVR